jgi:hypothetical protein
MVDQAGSNEHYAGHLRKTRWRRQGGISTMSSDGRRQGEQAGRGRRKGTQQLTFRTRPTVGAIAAQMMTVTASRRDDSEDRAINMRAWMVDRE